MSTIALESRTESVPATKVAGPKIAYTMSRFPKVTETFIVREMLELQRQGVAVEVYPLRREKTSVVQPEAMPFVEQAHFTPIMSLAILWANLQMLTTKPASYLGTLATLIRANWGSRRYFTGAIVYFPKAVYLAKRMRADGVTHLHAHFASHPAAVAFVIGRLAGIPYSFTAHGSDLHRDQHMLPEKTRDAAFVVAISDYNRSMILDVCGPAQADKVHVVRCGIDPQRFARRTEPTALDRGRGPMRIVCVGTLHEVKGQRYLIKACQQLAERGIAVRCHFLGSGPDEHALRELAVEAGLREAIIFHGTCTSEEVSRQLSAADCLVAPSVPSSDGRREGIPVVLMEAMATGLPCVSSRLSGIPELVDDEETGYLTEPGNVDQIAAALERLAANAQLRKDMGQAGLEKVLRGVSRHGELPSPRRVVPSFGERSRRHVVSEALSRDNVVIGIMHLGDLGSSLAALFMRNGFRVITCCADRSDATRQRAADVGVDVVATLEEFVRRADLVISLVSPAAAVQVAERYVSLASQRPAHAIYLDANSIDLDATREIESKLRAVGMELVDATIHGGAKRLEELAMLYLSGPRAEQIATLLDGTIKLQVVGPTVGQAKTLKLLLGGISKSLNALFLEIGAVANHADMTDSFLESCQYFYPGVMTAIDRMLPTYPAHAARRVDELSSIESLATARAVHADMIAAAGRVIARFADLDIDDSELTGTAEDVLPILALAARSQATTNDTPTKAMP